MQHSKLALKTAVLAMVAVAAIALPLAQPAHAEQSVAQILAADGAVIGGNTTLVNTQTFDFSQGATMKIAAFAADSGVTSFGIYNPSNPSSKTELWNDSVPNGTTVALPAAPRPFGLYIDDEAFFGVIPDWYTQTSLNADGAKHADVYQRGDNTWYIAFEDRPNPGSDMDKNDLVVKMTAVPEPGSVASLAFGGLGLLGLAVRARKTRRVASAA